MIVYIKTLFSGALITPYNLQVNQLFYWESVMKKPTLSKKIIAAAVALIAAIAASFGLVLNDDVQGAVVDTTCGTVVECSE